MINYNCLTFDNTIINYLLKYIPLQDYYIIEFNK